MTAPTEAPVATVTPELGAFRIKITGDESRPRRKRYLWQVLHWTDRNKYGEPWSDGEPGWDYIWRSDGFGFPTDPVQGYARTMRDAERAARIVLVEHQLTAPADPTTPAPFVIEVD